MGNGFKEEIIAIVFIILIVLFFWMVRLFSANPVLGIILVVIVITVLVVLTKKSRGFRRFESRIFGFIRKDLTDFSMRDSGNGNKRDEDRERLDFRLETREDRIPDYLASRGVGLNYRKDYLTRNRAESESGSTKMPEQHDVPASIKKLAFERAGYKCEVCGSDIGVRVQRIEESRGNLFSNLIVLCSEHVEEFRRGILSPKKLQRYKKY